MKYDIEITETAQRDFENIYLYISENLCNKQAAVRLISMLDKNIRSLSDIPEGYPLADDEYLRNIGLRFVSVKNYLIFYTVNLSKKKVYMLRILYEKRNWVNILRSDLQGQ